MSCSFLIAEKVKFLGGSKEQIAWANGDDPTGKLEVGKVYDVDHISVHSWHTRVYIIGFETWFNSVMFSNADEYSDECEECADEQEDDDDDASD